MVRQKGSPLCDGSHYLLIWSKVQLFLGWINRKSHRASYPPALLLSMAKVSPGGKEAIQTFLVHQLKMTCSQLGMSMKSVICITKAHDIGEK